MRDIRLHTRSAIYPAIFPRYCCHARDPQDTPCAKGLHEKCACRNTGGLKIRIRLRRICMIHSYFRDKTFLYARQKNHENRLKSFFPYKILTVILYHIFHRTSILSAILYPLYTYRYCLYAFYIIAPRAAQPHALPDLPPRSQLGVINFFFVFHITSYNSFVSSFCRTNAKRYVPFCRTLFHR